MSKKSHCYREDCCTTLTGWRGWTIKVCTACKEEIADTLYDHIEKYKKKPEKKDNSDLHPDYNYSDPEDY